MPAYRLTVVRKIGPRRTTEESYLFTNNSVNKNMKKSTLFIRNIMRTTILIYSLLMVCTQLLLAGSSVGQVLDKSVDASFSNTNLYEALKLLQSNEQIEFAFDEHTLRLEEKNVAAFSVRGTSVKGVLDRLLAGTNIGYEAKGANTVILFKKQQPGRISGRVTDSNGEPLASANVRVVELNRSLTTDNSGYYTIPVAPGTYTIEVSYISFIRQRSGSVAVSENQTTTVNFTLEQEDTALDEVVVTALGIKREEKALGYAATVVQGEQLTDALSSNWMDALSGKVAGLNLMRSNAGPVGSSKIILRGESNLTGDNEALIVVDGIVLNQSSGTRSANASDNIYGTGSDNMPADYGTGIDDINPEDIESVTVLKGPGAAALYGQRGAHGAVIITTKSGSRNRKGLGITINSNSSIEQVNRWPDLQFEYGQGLAGAAHYSYGASEDGASTSGTSSAYGPKFDGQYFFQYDPVTQARGLERTLWQPYPNKVNEFFDVGQTYTNSVSIDGGTERTTARFSATNVQNSWIVPNTGYNRNTIAMSVNSKVSDKLQISSKVNYNNRWSDNLPGAGYGNQSLMYWYIFWQPSADLDWLRNYWVNEREGLQIRYPYSTYPENPYAIAYEFLNRNNRHTFNGNVQASYDFNKEWSLQVRTSMDFSYENREQLRPYDAGSRLPEGSYRTQGIFSNESSVDVLLRYNKDINEDWNISVSGGGSTLNNNYRIESLSADGLTYPGVYNMSNSKYGVISNQQLRRFVINSFYGLATASYKEFLYLDVTARQDWTSTLATVSNPDKSKGFFYPSVNLSFIGSEVWNLPQQINFAKLRASFAEVGSGGTRPYLTDYSYIAPSSQFGGALANPTTLVNPFLEPLRTRSYEVGADLRFFDSRLGIDVAVYRGSTFNQHLERVIDASTGYRRYLINVGEVSNTGTEVAINGGLIKKKDGLNWNANIVFSTNSNRIEQLADSSLVLQSRPVGSGQLVATVGGSMGDLYGIGYQRAPDGQVIYNPSTGVALLTDEVVYLGNTIPKGKVSLGNDFRYKNFRLNVLFDAQWGAVGHSLTNYKLSEQGKTTNTLPGRYSGIIGNGVLQNPDGSFRPNDVVATDIDQYYRSHFGYDNAEGSTFSTDFIKFREARLDYTFKPQLMARLGLQRATIGVYGRNLFIWTPWPIFDPEFGTLSGSDIVRGFEIAQFPSTRTFGLNLILGL